jgi:hypothetical protein
MTRGLAGRERERSAGGGGRRCEGSGDQSRCTGDWLVVLRVVPARVNSRWRDKQTDHITVFFPTRNRVSIEHPNQRRFQITRPSWCSVSRAVTHSSNNRSEEARTGLRLLRADPKRMGAVFVWESWVGVE